MTIGKRYKFQGTTIAAVGAWGSTNNISGITNANPAVVTDTGHGLADNDIVKLAGIVGMTELNDRVFVINVLDVDTYELRGIDSTNFGAYSSGGTWAKATLTNFCELTGVSGSSGTTAEIGVSTVCSDAAEKEFGLSDPGTVTYNYNLAPLSTIQAALEAARKAVTMTALKITLPKSAGIMVDIGTITQTSTSGSVGGVWTGSCVLARAQERVDIAAA